MKCTAIEVGCNPTKVKKTIAVLPVPLPVLQVPPQAGVLAGASLPRLSLPLSVMGRTTPACFPCRVLWTSPAMLAGETGGRKALGTTAYHSGPHCGPCVSSHLGGLSHPVPTGTLACPTFQTLRLRATAQSSRSGPHASPLPSPPPPSLQLTLPGPARL